MPKLWGAGIAGYQVDGVHCGKSLWSEHEKIWNRNPHEGVKFFENYQSDIKNAHDLGINSFRFSIEWSMIEPEEGKFSEEGFKYYENLFNELEKYSLEPVVTLIHFNYTWWLFEKYGGLVNTKKFTECFGRFVEAVVERFGKKVTYWLTFNEPNTWILSSYVLNFNNEKIHPPAHSLNWAEYNDAKNTIMESHRLAYNIIHSYYKKHLSTINPMVSTNMFWIPSVKDIKDIDVIGSFISSLGSDLGMINDIGIDYMDYISFDYYYIFNTLENIMNVKEPSSAKLYPRGLYDALIFCRDNYKRINKDTHVLEPIPVMIPENGVCTEGTNSRKDQYNRKIVLIHHIKEMYRAINDGAKVLGYFHWSLLDNYEWGSFKYRFGLYSVDFQNSTLQRTPANQINGDTDVSVYKEIIGYNKTGKNEVPSDLLEKYPLPN